LPEKLQNHPQVIDFRQEWKKTIIDSNLTTSGNLDWLEQQAKRGEQNCVTSFSLEALLRLVVLQILWMSANRPFVASWSTWKILVSRVGLPVTLPGQAAPKPSGFLRRAGSPMGWPKPQ